MKKRTRGQGMAEYIVIVGLGAMGLVAGVKAFSKKVDAGYDAMTYAVEDGIIDEMGRRQDPGYQEFMRSMNEKKKQDAKDKAETERLEAERQQGLRELDRRDEERRQRWAQERAKEEAEKRAREEIWAREDAAEEQMRREIAEERRRNGLDD